MAKADLTAQRLRELLHYDPETGVFTRRENRSGSCNRKGTIAGSAGKHGRSRIMVCCKNYWAHRLAWLYMTSEWPRLHIDHIDGDPSNNAFANLRDVPRNVNAQNQRRAHKGNASGYLGVLKNGRNWSARIVDPSSGNYRHLGTFKTPEEAHDKYLVAKRALHAGCAI